MKYIPVSMMICDNQTTGRIVRVNEIVYVDIRLITEYAVLLSSPVVGSSSNRILGSVSSFVAIPVLFFSPPDIPRDSTEPTKESLNLLNFICSIYSSTAVNLSSSLYLAEGSRSIAIYRIVSETVKYGLRLSSCSTYDSTFLNFRGSLSSPLNSTSPIILPFVIRPAITFNKVVFPDPDDPITATNSPLFISKETLLNIVFWLKFFFPPELML
ncbi:hypothetical protein AYI70_g4155 [Smittium culicis]|uniref:Uncharacterized protein n=1 Tax=Smittium culicis TaxID=133412 RepID=A0A1R1Y0P9_9FUNG|nr:hypothetical protein AYI70_g4155 [Smittium culicis]